MDNIRVKIVNRGPHPTPAYATEQSAGMDVHAWLEAPLTLAPMQRALIHTGLYIALPEGVECQVRPRSGMALKRGLTVLNTPGTIDADYRGEIGIILINLDSEPQTISDGERIAQLVITEAKKPELEVVESLDQTDRGDNGFGSTGR